MDGMPARVEKYRQEVDQRRPVNNFRSTFKRLEKMAKEEMEAEASRTRRSSRDD